MFKESFAIVREELSAYLQKNTGISDDSVVVSNLVDSSGSPEAFAAEKVCITMINAEHETYANRAENYAPQGNGNYSVSAMPISLNLFMLFTSNYSAKNYEDGLAHLSGVMSFFQGKRLFNHQNTPTLNANIERLTFEYVNLKAHDLSHLWGAMGAKYRPSALFKVRMITFQSQPSDTVPSVAGVGGNGQANAID